MLKWCSLFGNSSSRTGIWLNWAEHMSPAFMLKSISANMTDPGQHPGAKSLLLPSFKQLPSAQCALQLTSFGVRIIYSRNNWNVDHTFFFICPSYCFTHLNGMTAEKWNSVQHLLWSWYMESAIGRTLIIPIRKLFCSSFSILEWERLNKI